MRLVVIASITRNNGKAVMNGSRGDNQVWLGESMARLPPFLDQKAPLEHDVFGDLENPMVSSARRFGSSTSSMPKRISARVTALT